MLHILLVILKMIGIVLAVVLSLLLFLFLIFAFGPIRYKATGEAEEKIYLEGHISWIFFILRCKIQYTSEKGLCWYVRIFGYLFASNEKEFLERKKKKKEIPVEKRIPDVEEIPSEKEVPRPKEVPVKSEQPVIRKEETSDHNKEKVTMIKKGREIIHAGKESFAGLKKKVTSIPGKLEKMRENIEKNCNRLIEIKEYFLGEQNKEVMKKIFSHIKKMLGHILPDRIRGRVEFGLHDPYIMGQILAILGILMPIYQDRLTVIPDFEEEKLKGDFSLNGIIFPGYLLLHLFILIMDKEVRRVIKEGKEQLLGGKS